MKKDHIRNFSIIAHIDHGKSTLADRVLEITGLMNPRDKKDQYLDRMELERERGITIKAQAVRLPYKARNGQTYELNLIDTPGHVDFNYEVSRSLKACEGAILVVDASQGVEAQTVANAYLALDNDLEIMPVMNKIDLPSADVERVRHEIEDIIGLPADDALAVSAKTGVGVPEMIEALIERIPAPKGDDEAPLQALVFDSWYDNYLGAVVMVRVVAGRVRKGDRILLMGTGKTGEIMKLGVFQPDMIELDELSSGEVGYIAVGIKEIEFTRVGDTLTLAERPAKAPLEGFREVKPMVFSGLYPTDTDDYVALREALEKFKLNDYAFTFEPESSKALGFGFRCGYLGLLHMEIVCERIDREYDLSVITTVPTVIYRVNMKDGEVMQIDNPSLMPDAMKILSIEEPMVHINIHTLEEHIGPVLKLCEERRGIQLNMNYVSGNRMQLEYKIPLNEIILDFHDKLKSVSRGYASFDYELLGYEKSDLVKIDILINGEELDSLCTIVHRSQAYNRGLALCQKMKELIPRQQYEVAIQAAIGTRVVARTTVKAFRKNVTAKCYGGDITRKRKLLEKQKEGKKRMKRVGHVEIPQEAFLAVLKLEDEK